MDLTHIGRTVVGKQINALETLRDALPITFDPVVRVLAKCAGRVIVSGMGKSGLIAAKIAATLSSMGTPSFSVHPGDASHGDLGMITSQDVVIIISKSGESQELSDLIHYSRRLGIPLIAITGSIGSNLGKLADLVLELPQAEESGIGNAPTTSTTLTLVLGDALAVATARLRGFQENDFHKYHPGGSLGKQFLTVGTIMDRSIPVVHPHENLSVAIQVMTTSRKGMVLVMQDSKMVGVITDGDIRRAFLDDNRTIETIMSTTPKFINPQKLAVEALHEMNQLGISCVPVCEGQTVIGILHIHDCLRAGL